MIPTQTISDAAEQPLAERTWRIDRENERLSGVADGLEALRQAIYLILSTERAQYLIYSPAYGAELSDLIGRPYDYAQSEIKRRVTETLEQDDRILSVEDFSFTRTRGQVTATFTVRTIYGDLREQMEVTV